MFDRIADVRTVNTDKTLGSMAYGMLRATHLLSSYMELGWIRHPDVNSALVMASLQKEGKNIRDAMGNTKGKLDQIDKNQTAIDSLQGQLNKLKQLNPGWKTG